MPRRINTSASGSFPEGRQDSLLKTMESRPQSAPLLDIRNLSISFDLGHTVVPAVTDFSLTIGEGEAVGLVGESGCGKSTVALAIMQDLGTSGRVTGGAVLLKGRDLARLGDRELRRVRGREIAMVYQEPMAALNPAMTVGAQLQEVPVIHKGVSTRAAKALARQMVRDVGLPDPERILSSYPHQLSGGQQQRIVIAMALMSKPSLLILDEPTTALDVTVEAAIIELIKDLTRQFSTSILFVSHNLGLILETCDRICVMYSGEAVEVGSVGTVFQTMRHPYTQALFRSIPLPGTDKTERPLVAIPGSVPFPHERPRGCNFGQRCTHFRTGVCDATDIPMTPVLRGVEHVSRCVRVDDIDWEAPPPAVKSNVPTSPGELVLRCTGLKKRYAVGANPLTGQGARATVKANEDVSFEARAGETLAIVGESGCGKSTLAKVLMGLETASEGVLSLNGEAIADKAVQRRGRETVAGIQMVFQNPFDTLNPSMTVGAQIMRALEVLGPPVSDQARRERMVELLDLIKLPREYAERLPWQLSGGQKQRVGIARALAGGARVVVADEPVSALDVSVQAAVSDLLLNLQRTRQTTLLFISHDLSIVHYLADRVMLMYLGHVVETGTKEQVFSPPYHPYTEALLSAAPIADLSVKKRKVILEGDVPSALDPPSGCPFQTRCRWKSRVPDGLCETIIPPLRQLADGHHIKCHLNDKSLEEMQPVFSMSGPRR